MPQNYQSRKETQKAWGKLFAGVNRPADTENLTDLKKKHFPVITAPDSIKAGECFEMIVEVDKLLAHPNEHGHFIQFIELYADDVYLGRTDFTAISTCPATKFCVSLPGPIKELRAYGYCNLHGAWAWSAPIAVIE